MPKELVVLCDGTGCSPERHGTPTNVQMLYNIFARSSFKKNHPLQRTKESGKQKSDLLLQADSFEIKTIYDESVHPKTVKKIVYYDRGLGASLPKPDGNLSWSEWFWSFLQPLSDDLDQIGAVHLLAKVAQAYHFLAQNYQFGDKIYLFGFSRGAYTLRTLITFMRYIGLVDVQKVPSGQLEAIIQAGFQLYNKAEDPDKSLEIQQFRSKYSHIKGDSYYKNMVNFLGLWDTVPGILFYPIHHQNLSINNLVCIRPTLLDQNNFGLTAVVSVARHALAIDEKRPLFKAEPWEASLSTNSVQMWFPGNHGDVGGGYEYHSLSNQTLSWMIQEFNKSMDETLQYCPEGSGLLPQHDALQEPVVVGLPITWDCIGGAADRVIPDAADQYIHSSVWERYGQLILVIMREDYNYAEQQLYKPSNIPNEQCQDPLKQAQADLPPLLRFSHTQTKTENPDKEESVNAERTTVNTEDDWVIVPSIRF